MPILFVAGPGPMLSGSKVKDLVSFELSVATGEVAKSDVDGDGKTESFVVLQEKSGGIAYGNIVKIDGKDTMEVAGFPVFEGEKTPISMGFADVTGDGKPEALIAFPGTLIFMDMANPEGEKASEFARISPSYPIASSFEVLWPQVIAKSPDGDFSYTRDASGLWIAEPLNWEPEPEDY